jgi:hypothetical protein
MESIFDFRETDNEYVYNVNSIALLHIKQYSSSVAILYFTNYLLIKVDIPDGIVVYTYDNENNKQRLNSARQEYPLCWTDNYIVELNDKLILQIENRRKWNITSI